MRATLVILSFLLAACGTAPVQVSGRYASSLSQADIQQITALVSSRRDFGYPLRSIVAVSRDRARVVTGRSDSERSWTGTRYFVSRRGSLWFVADPDGFEGTTERIVTVY